MSRVGGSGLVQWTSTSATEGRRRTKILSRWVAAGGPQASSNGERIKRGPYDGRVHDLVENDVTVDSVSCRMAAVQ